MTDNLADPARILLVQSLNRFMEIGDEITKLTKESEFLREKIAQCAEGLGFGPIVKDDDPVEFLVGDIEVSVSIVQHPAAHAPNDYTVLTKKLKQV